MISNDTIVALATPSGLGAIAVLRLAGSRAFAIADLFFRGKKTISAQKSYSILFGKLTDEDGNLIDEVLVSVFKSPHSYTGDDIVEISCHGSPFIQQKILEIFLKNGARSAEPGEFTQRAFLNGKIDLSQAEAVADLIASQNSASHRVALHQMRGGFSSEIKSLREELIHFAALIELELDFSEEDVEFANRAQLNFLLKKIQEEIAHLTASFRLGNAIKNGVPTVIAGRPNSGKSTLLNAFLNENRAIVSEIPGTTRDTIEEILTIQGIQFRLIDTAGIRQATDAVEQIGIEKTMQKIASAAILIYLFDVVETQISEVLTDLKMLSRPDLEVIVVPNKMDLLPFFDPEWLENPHDLSIPKHILGENLPADFPKISKKNVVTLSAKNAMNVPYLQEKLVEKITGGRLNFESVIVTNMRHVEALQRADFALENVQKAFEAGLSSELVAQDIREVLRILGEITGGEILADDLLGAIFSKFCIGK